MLYKILMPGKLYVVCYRQAYFFCAGWWQNMLFVVRRSQLNPVRGKRTSSLHWSGLEKAIVSFPSGHWRNASHLMTGNARLVDTRLHRPEALWPHPAFSQSQQGPTFALNWGQGGEGFQGAWVLSNFPSSRVWSCLNTRPINSLLALFATICKAYFGYTFTKLEPGRGFSCPIPFRQLIYFL